jgi:putative GTP pyrophosphokinase
VADDLIPRYTARFPLLKALCDTLAREARDALDGMPHIDSVRFRVKDPDRFASKAGGVIDGQPRYVDPLREVEDQIGGRVVVFFRRDIPPVEDALRKAFHTQESTTKEPHSPQCFDYESRHQIFLIPTHLAPATWSDREDLPIAFEMQVRTLFMHAWAEPQHDLGYKPDEPLPREAERLIASAAASAWGADHAFEDVLDIVARSA